jgi:carbon monoxide dehydrogenase subunit G
MMAEISTFESRTGRISCSAAKAFDFLTDLRNFIRFIPANAIRDLVIDADSCSFQADMLGIVEIRISKKVLTEKVVYTGTMPHVKDFSMSADIRDNPAGDSEIKLFIRAELNPFLKMMAAEPVKRVLGTIIDEMEKFRDWEATT